MFMSIPIFAYRDLRDFHICISFVRFEGAALGLLLFLLPNISYLGWEIFYSSSLFLLKINKHALEIDDGQVVLSKDILTQVAI